MIGTTLPVCPCTLVSFHWARVLRPEDAGGDGLGAVAHGLPVEALAGDAAVGLDVAVAEFLGLILLERLRIDADDTPRLLDMGDGERPEPGPAG